MGSTSTIPMLSLDSGLTHYLTEIRKFPMLTPVEETVYANGCATKATGKRRIISSPAT
jgi:hypothetical protein